MGQYLIVGGVLVLWMEDSLDEALAQGLVDVDVDEDVAEGASHLARRYHYVGLTALQADAT